MMIFIFTEVYCETAIQVCIYPAEYLNRLLGPSNSFAHFNVYFPSCVSKAGCDTTEKKSNLLALYNSDWEMLSCNARDIPITGCLGLRSGNCVVFMLFQLFSNHLSPFRWEHHHSPNLSSKHFIRGWSRFSDYALCSAFLSFYLFEGV